MVLGTGSGHSFMGGKYICYCGLGRVHILKLIPCITLIVAMTVILSYATMQMIHKQKSTSLSEILLGVLFIDVYRYFY